MLALEVCATARHTAGGLRIRTERAVRLTYESAVLPSIGYPGGLHRIAARPTTFPYAERERALGSRLHKVDDKVKLSVV